MDTILHRYTLVLCCRQLLQTRSVTTKACVSPPRYRRTADGPSHRHHVVSGDDAPIASWHVNGSYSPLLLYLPGNAPKRHTARMSCLADEPGCMTGSSSCQRIQHRSLLPRV